MSNGGVFGSISIHPFVLSGRGKINGSEVAMHVPHLSLDTFTVSPFSTDDLDSIEMVRCEIPAMNRSGINFRCVLFHFLH